MSKFLSAVKNTLGRKSTVSRAHAYSTLPPVTIHRTYTPEPQHRYEPGGYHAVLPGEVYNQRYKVIRKLGWGIYSTVWLVRDTQDQNLAAMKVLVGDLTVSENKGAWDELGMLNVIRESDPESTGYPHAMNLSVLEVYRAFPGAMPIPLLKRISKHVLRALQYLHEECGIIHTDIKGDNILMTGILPDSEERQPSIELNDSELMSTTFKLSDFGAANMMSNRFAKMIQPGSLRSPEVIIGAEWDTKADIWNLGCLIYEFARGTKLFDPFWDNENSGMNATQTHLSQIAGLCGDLPSEFLKRGRRSGMYFDDHGSLLRGAGRYSITLEDLLSRAGHSHEEVYEIADFLSFMLIINPEERWSAAQLLDHLWLKNSE